MDYGKSESPSRQSKVSNNMTDMLRGKKGDNKEGVAQQIDGRGGAGKKGDLVR